MFGPATPRQRRYSPEDCRILRQPYTPWSNFQVPKDRAKDYPRLVGTPLASITAYVKQVGGVVHEPMKKGPCSRLSTKNQQTGSRRGHADKPKQRMELLVHDQRDNRMAMAQLLSWIATWLVDLWHEPTAISGTMSRFSDGSCCRSAGGRATGEAGSGCWRIGVEVLGCAGGGMKQFGPSRLPAAHPALGQPRLGAYSLAPGQGVIGGVDSVSGRPCAVLTGDIGREWEEESMVGIRRLNCRRRAARQPSSTRSAPSLAYGGRDGWECGRWEGVRHGW